VSRTVGLPTVLWLVVLTILAGTVVGVCLDRMVLDPRFHRGMRARMRQEFMDRIHKELALSSAQTVQVDSILKVQEKRMERLRGEIGERVKATQDTFMTDMGGVLTPEQMTKLKQMAPPNRRGFGRMFGGRRDHDQAHGPGPGPGDDNPPPPPK